MSNFGYFWASGGGGGGAPSGAAGGFLSGTYPDPGVAADLTSYPLKWGASPPSTGFLRWDYAAAQAFLTAENSVGTAIDLITGSGNTIYYGGITAGWTNVVFWGGTARVASSGSVSMDSPTFTWAAYAGSACITLTPLLAGATTTVYASTVTSVGYSQSDTSVANGAGWTVQAQNATGASSTGGALNLVSGTGTSTNGTINFKVGGTTTASLATSKFIFAKGVRRTVTGTSSTPYAVLISDDVVAVTPAAAFAVTLPAATTGDTYTVKDITGVAGTYNITITPAAGNIDGAATFVMTTNYQSVTLVYTGAQWSVV